MSEIDQDNNGFIDQDDFRLLMTQKLAERDQEEELRKLLDLLSIGPVRYVLTGVGAWNEASIETLQAFLTRWRSSRFETLTAGANVLVRLTASSSYVLPVSWPATGYPGPLAHVFATINS
jgi:hypothetical protein